MNHMMIGPFHFLTQCTPAADSCPGGHGGNLASNVSKPLNNIVISCILQQAKFLMSIGGED